MENKFKGPKKSNQHINPDSGKYIQRTNAGRAKESYGKNGKHGSHILSFCVTNTFYNNQPGQPFSSQNKQKIVKYLNQNENISIKSARSNQIVDERQDARISDALIYGDSLQYNTSIKRAQRQYEIAQGMDELSSLAEAFGELKIYNQETGRCHKLKNHHKY
ncbi:hypothetical protein PPERSA_00330 [Pseudocohnilembus persalinus]|uniref:Uncharacterized protein n=1 Tax=Pseudocohnilembus persalinus TaxID=266149 RepID=A0A0V0QHC9_PSEPJ|nr:hypothetical protein PPERSA_00330 [Pseudocohnilembus persalinus]|eukprot:KRX01623.1 hypothetical protein PPERSA_00330 [Pseudocohnilembus persalinus]